MNLEKLTDRAKGFLQAAQTIAIRMNHQRIGAEHLLKALLDDEQGMAASLNQVEDGVRLANEAGADPFANLNRPEDLAEIAGKID